MRDTMAADHGEEDVLQDLLHWPVPAFREPFLGFFSPVMLSHSTHRIWSSSLGQPREGDCGLYFECRE